MGFCTGRSQGSQQWRKILIKPHSWFSWCFIFNIKSLVQHNLCYLFIWISFCSFKVLACWKNLHKFNFRVSNKSLLSDVKCILTPSWTHTQTLHCSHMPSCRFLFNIQTHSFHMTYFVCVCVLCMKVCMHMHTCAVSMPVSPTCCICICRSPQSHITSTSTPADPWGQRAVIGSSRSRDHSSASLGPPSFSLTYLFFKTTSPSLLLLSGWKWADGWGATACDPQLNSSVCSHSTCGGFLWPLLKAKLHLNTHTHTQ